MQSKVIWALLALNVLLAVGLLTPLVNPAEAQQASRPSDYLLIPGQIVGGSNSVVWVIDGKNEQLSAVTLDINGKALDMMAPVDIGRLMGNAPQRK